MIAGMREVGRSLAQEDGVTNEQEVAEYVRIAEAHARRRLHRERLEARYDVVLDLLAEAMVEKEDAERELSRLQASPTGGAL